MEPRLGGVVGKVVAVGLGVALVGGVGCAYYNGFYNAKKSFSEAEDIGRDIDPRNQPTGAQRAKYATCIQKCENLLEEYPDSGLIDDALFLMGKANYRLKNYRDAIRYLDNVLVNFPNSEFEEEVHYTKSLAHLILGEEQVALDQFRLLRENYPSGRFGVESLYRLGDAYREREQYDQAVLYYEEYLENYPKDKARDEVILAAGSVYVETEEYAKAVEILEQVNRRKAPRRVRFDADVMRVRALMKLDRTEEASYLLPPVANEAEYFKETGSIRILQGEIQLALGNERQGESILDDVARSYPNSAHPAHARFILASYFLDTYGPDDERVMEQLKASVEGQARGEYGTDVRDLKEQLNRYGKLKERLDEGDSTAFQAAFGLGELLLVELDRPREAVGYYRQCLALAPDAELAPRAAYAVAYIQNSQADPDSVQLAYDFLRENYPDSPQAMSLDGAVFLEPKPRAAPPTEGDLGAAVAAGMIAADGHGDRDGRNGAVDPLSDPRRALRRGGPGASIPRAGPGR